MKFSAVILDFNGVLLWDEALQVEAWQTAGREVKPEVQNIILKNVNEISQYMK